MNPNTQAVISGLMSGASYALLGVGLVLVYRTSRLLNLAHGETFVIGAVTVVLLAAAGVPVWIGILGGLVTTLLFYLGLQQFVLQPRSNWPTGTLVLITIGTAFVVRGVLILLIHTDPVSFPVIFTGMPLRIAGGVIPRQGIALVVIGFGASLAVRYFLSCTLRGKELMATAENPDAAQLLGVNVNSARLTAYGISAALGLIAAVLLVPLISVDYQSGLSMSLRGFIAAATGGMSPGRTVVSGLGLGLLEAFVAVSIGALFQDPVMFGILILVSVWQSRHIRFGGGVRA